MSLTTEEQFFLRILLASKNQSLELSKNDFVPVCSHCKNNFELWNERALLNQQSKLEWRCSFCLNNYGCSRICFTNKKIIQ
jgi:hypothetical protein